MKEKKGEYSKLTPEMVEELVKGLTSLFPTAKVTVLKLKPKEDPESLKEETSKYPSTMSFSDALDYLKKGKCVCRSGWNGKDMFVYLNKGYANLGCPTVEFMNNISSELFEDSLNNNIVTRNPNLCLKDATNSISTWVPSTTDLLAEDWSIYEHI